MTTGTRDNLASWGLRQHLPSEAMLLRGYIEGFFHGLLQLGKRRRQGWEKGGRGKVGEWLFGERLGRVG